MECIALTDRSCRKHLRAARWVNTVAVAFVLGFATLLQPAVAQTNGPAGQSIDEEWAECGGPTITSEASFKDAPTVDRLLEPTLCLGRKDRATATRLLTDLHTYWATMTGYSDLVARIDEIQAQLSRYYGSPVIRDGTCENQTYQNSPGSFDINREVKPLYASSYLVSVEECYYERGDYHKSISMLDPLSRIEEVLPLSRLDKPGSDDVPLPIALDHVALAALRVGDHKTARIAIRRAHDEDWESPIGEVEADYQRIDAVLIAAKAKADTDSLKASVKAIENDRKEFASGYSGSMFRVASAYGRPCHMSHSDFPGGWIAIWQYDCIGNDGPGRESFTFVNGKLTEHTQL